MIPVRDLSLACLIVALLSACGHRPADKPEALLRRYVDAANRHDLETLGELIHEDAIWVLGGDTLIGRPHVLRPLQFDKGARTQLEISHIEVRGSKVDFEVRETNDVLVALGINELHHSPQFEFRDGLVFKITARRPPREQEEFVQKISAFSAWLRWNDPAAYQQIWPDGHFAYGEVVGERMPGLVRAWRQAVEQGN